MNHLELIAELRTACTEFENAYVGEREDRLRAEAALSAAEAEVARLKARLSDGPAYVPDGMLE